MQRERHTHWFSGWGEGGGAGSNLPPRKSTNCPKPKRVKAASLLRSKVPVIRFGPTKFSKEFGSIPTEMVLTRFLGGCIDHRQTCRRRNSPRTRASRRASPPPHKHKEHPTHKDCIPRRLCRRAIGWSYRSSTPCWSLNDPTIDKTDQDRCDPKYAFLPADAQNE
jgi:hypothetical protein